MPVEIRINNHKLANGLTGQRDNFFALEAKSEKAGPLPV